MHSTIQPCETLSVGGLWLAWSGATITTGSMILQPAPQLHQALACRSDPPPTCEVKIHSVSEKAQSSCVEGAHSQHAKLGGYEKEDVLLVSLAASEATALQLHTLQTST